MNRALLVISLSLAWGCGKKHGAGQAAEVAGLSAVPASAEIVISADVARVMDSPLVERAVDQLMLREPALATEWQRMHDSCKFDTARITHVLLAIGPKGNAQVGTGPVLMVASGKIAETEFSTCVRSLVGSGGGDVTAKTVAGHTLYVARDGSRIMYFSFGRADTVLLSSNEAFITEALTPGKKATENAELGAWIALADQKAPVWAAGRTDPSLRDRLVKLVGEGLSSGPVAITISFDGTAGAKLDLGAVMASPADAKTLESFAKNQISLLAMAAQAKSMGKLVDKIAISAEDKVVHVRLNLSLDEVNQLLSVLDAGGSAAQDSPPAGSGSSSVP
ncbi:MAG: hypothetical protein JO257_14865 [Deltaproteobacteria bacterium]|nr:hypothetical protein [Deltaproteobacteria bacterium]